MDEVENANEELVANGYFRRGKFGAQESEEKSEGKGCLCRGALTLIN